MYKFILKLQYFKYSMKRKPLSEADKREVQANDVTEIKLN